MYQKMDGRTDTRTVEMTDGRMDKRKVALTDGRRHRRTNRRIEDGWSGEQKGEGEDGRMMDGMKIWMLKVEVATV